MKKLALQIVLVILIVAMGAWLYNIIAIPMKFQDEKKVRQTVIVQKLKDIRVAQRAFKTANQRYAPTFDSLIAFIKHDSLVFERAIGSEDDSLAVAKGLVKREKFKVAALDTLPFSKNLNIDKLAILPFSGGKEFIMGAANLEASGVRVPVFEARAPYAYYLADLDQQELINLIDDCKTLDKYVGLKVGSLTEATNDAGNWE